MAIAVADVKLPERARARLNIEGDKQRAQKPHDIRGAIPLVDYTNPAKFPPYVFREYPKMPLLDGNRPIVIDETGNVLIFYDAADEVEFKDMNPEAAEEIERNAPARALADAIAAKDQEIDDLRARLKAAGLVDEAPRVPARKPVNALSGVTDTKTAETAQAAPETKEAAPDGKEDGLRSTLPPNNKKPATGGNPLTKKNN